MMNPEGRKLLNELFKKLVAKATEELDKETTVENIANDNKFSTMVSLIAVLANSLKD